jgi:hypothetical protein
VIALAWQQSLNDLPNSARRFYVGKTWSRILLVGLGLLGPLIITAPLPRQFGRATVPPVRARDHRLRVNAAAAAMLIATSVIVAHAHPFARVRTSPRRSRSPDSRRLIGLSSMTAIYELRGSLDLR